MKNDVWLASECLSDSRHSKDASGQYYLSLVISQNYHITRTVKRKLYYYATVPYMASYQFRELSTVTELIYWSSCPLLTFYVAVKGVEI